MTVYQTQVEFAEHRGITQSRVSRLVSKGKIPKSCIKKISGRKLIDRDKADIALGENLDQIYNRPKNPEPTKKKKVSPPDLPPDALEKIDAAGFENMTMAEAQEAQAQYKAALMKLEYEDKSKMMVRIEDVEKEFYNVARLTRDGVLNIPDRIGAELASISDVHKLTGRLTQELTTALNHLCEGRV